MYLSKNDLEKMESRYRATLINSLAGYKSAVLIGSQSIEGKTNLAIFNSLIHIGANPPLYGFLCRPDTVKRDTLNNILETGFYTFNFVSFEHYQKAHQTSAKYDSDVSEIAAVGFTEAFKNEFQAPFVSEAAVKIGLKFKERVDIKINGTIMIIGSIEFLEMDVHLPSTDGFVDPSKANLLACVGLDAYYKAEFIDRLSYAKTDKWPESLK
jgi:flavin reductase (DIM6/NTAB) family NADH-FMN oxidoreductase RutF